MKLRNKKTGEILGSFGSFIIQNPNRINCEAITKYDSLAELNEEWEDYEEEPKGWCVTMYGGISRISKDDENIIPELKEIGNYFNDKESAYDALAKLKAWKRLKDKCGISFSGVNRNIKGRPVSVNLDFNIEGRTTFDDAIQNTEDLMLVFGGEDESKE